MLIRPSVLIAISSLTYRQAHAFFRINCAIVQSGRVDPIVNPGGLAAHAHTIVGSSSKLRWHHTTSYAALTCFPDIGVNSTYDSLVAAQCTSCEIGADKSAYWTPNLYYQYPNGSFEYVPHTGSVIYYLSRGPNGNNLTVFPPGFRMVSGDKALRAPDQAGMTWGNATYPSRHIAEAVSFACLSVIQGPETPGLPADPLRCVSGLRAQVHFQTCWNGKDLYKQDNSHVAHTSAIDDGVCPPSYPYQLPHVFMETNYAVNKVSDSSSGGRFVFSQGDATGYGFHGDFFNGWKSEVFVEAIQTCLINNGAPFGTIDECPILIASDSPQSHQNCPERPPQILEPVKGMIDQLPGCVRVTTGPGAATAADMNCPAGVRHAEIATTSDSVPLPTYTPAIGSPLGNPDNVHLGCGNDTYGSMLRAVNALYTEDDAMTIEYCQTYCNSRGYRVSALEDGTQCYCDLTVNPSVVFTDKFATRYGCMMTCAGNRSEICGGPFYVNVYNNTDPTFVATTDVSNSVYQLTVPPAPYDDYYYGCATEGNNGRALNGSSFNSENMTIGSCKDKCQSDNYALYGLEFATQCWCGNALASGSRLVDIETSPARSSCNRRCAGDFAQICGQANLLSVYRNPAYTPVSVTRGSGKYAAKGCLTEPSGGRALAGKFTVLETAMTPQRCIKFCLGSRFHYAGYVDRSIVADLLFVI